MLLASGMPRRKSARSEPLAGPAAAPCVAAPVNVNAPRGFLLEQLVVLLLAEFTANGDVVLAAINDRRCGDIVAAVAIEGAVGVAEGGEATGETQRRRSPIRGILVVAGDSGACRHVHAVVKVGSDLGAQSAESVTGEEEQIRLDAVRPVDVAVDAERAGLIDKAEQVHVVGSRALKRKPSIELVLSPEGLIQMGLQRILVRIGHHRRLIVIACHISDVGQRIELQQRLRLRTDRNLIIRVGRARGGIVDGHRLAERIGQPCQIAVLLILGWHKAGQDLRTAIARPLIGDKKVRARGSRCGMLMGP